MAEPLPQDGWRSASPRFASAASLCRVNDRRLLPSRPAASAPPSGILTPFTPTITPAQYLSRTTRVLDLT